MKKDLKSYERHDRDYVADKETYYESSAITERTKRMQTFKYSGFELAFKLLNPLPKIHIDIGSGVGWLTKETSSLFDEVIGIEPSAAAVAAAKELTRDVGNVSFINTDMVDGLNKIAPKEAVFVTTSAVLSHIEDFYVSDFLKLVDNLPVGSKLFFSENYDKNVHWKYWHIRNKDWWREQLPHWQLVFLDVENEGYPLGFLGLKLEEKELVKNRKKNFFERAYWNMSLIPNIAIRALQKLSRVLLGLSKIRK